MHNVIVVSGIKFNTLKDCLKYIEYTMLDNWVFITIMQDEMGLYEVSGRCESPLEDYEIDDEDE